MWNQSDQQCRWGVYVCDRCMMLANVNQRTSSASQAGERTNRRRGRFLRELKGRIGYEPHLADKTSVMPASSQDLRGEQPHEQSNRQTPAFHVVDGMRLSSWGTESACCYGNDTPVEY